MGNSSVTPFRWSILLVAFVLTGCSQAASMPTITPVPDTATPVPTDTAALTATWTIAPSDTSTVAPSATPTQQNTATQEATATQEVLFGEGNIYLIWNDRGPDTEPDISVQEYVQTITPDIWKNATRLMVNTDGVMSELPWDARIVIQTPSETRYGYPCVVGKVLADTSEVNPKKLYVPFIFPGNGGMIVATKELKFDEISIKQDETFYSFGPTGVPAAWLTSSRDNPIDVDAFSEIYYSDAWNLTAGQLFPNEEEARMRSLEGSQIWVFFVDVPSEYFDGGERVIDILESQRIITNGRVDAITIPFMTMLP